jgi:hypothetical protein
MASNEILVNLFVGGSMSSLSTSLWMRQFAAEQKWEHIWTVRLNDDGSMVFASMPLPEANPNQVEPPDDEAEGQPT